MKLAVSIAIVLATVSSARADCPERAANCLLHEEGVVLLSQSKFAEAAAKFRASIAAAPTARSYLGYSQALEGDGRIALAYEAMLAAQQLSNDEVAKAGSDVDVTSRAERIKYKLAEQKTKVGFAWLRLPDGVPAQRLVAVQRKDESDIPSPLTRLVPVAPHQEMTASLNDGTRISFVADIAPGGTAAVVIPINGQRVAASAQGPVRAPVGYTLPNVRSVYAPPTETPEVPLPTMSFGMDVGFIAPGFDQFESGVGIYAYYERQIAHGLMIDVHVGYLYHPPITPVDVEMTFSSNEGLIVAGIRTQSHSALYGLVQAGALIYAQDISTPSGDTTFSYTYPTFVVGGGLRTGGFHLEAAVVYAINAGSDVDLPVRFMGTIGFDFARH
ncbi:MAG TPA: hypothetical protein VGO00_00275 [Kofleriaceae bacterium]|jgi:hypothetical protein|nr:hypothetical protein [Kofleriaceae bacterium]